MSDRTVTFSELASEKLLEVGAGRPRSVLSDQYPSLPILRVADVLDGRIESSFQDYLPDSHRKAIGPKISKPGDVVLTTKGTVGRVALMPPDGPAFAYSPQLCYFRPAANGPLRPRYLYYWFKSTEFWDQADALKGQTDMADYLSLSDIQSLKIRIPSLDQQAGIVDVLGSLDDKIAINNDIVINSQKLSDALHEQAVRGIYPGGETFSSIANVFGGGTPRTAEPSYWDGDILWATPSDVTALQAPYLFGTKRMITSTGLESCASRLYPAGSIFMTSRATIGAFAVPQLPAAVNQGFIVVIPKDSALRWWLFHEMRSRVDEMLSLANGSTFLELSRKNFKAMAVRLASPEIIAEFDVRAEALHRRAAHSAQETQTLAELRDTLLPKLMSGEIKLRDAEKVVEDAV